MTTTLPRPRTTDGVKTCSRCAQDLALSEFPHKYGGRGSTCKACMREYGRAYYAAHADTRKRQVRVVREATMARRRAVLEMLARASSCDVCARTYDESHRANPDAPGLALIGYLPDGGTLGSLVRGQVSTAAFTRAAWRRGDLALPSVCDGATAPGGSVVAAGRCGEGLRIRPRTAVPARGVQRGQ